MRKNRVFWSTLGISAVLHGLVMIGVAGDGFRTPHPVSKYQFVSTLKLVKVETTSPQRTVPAIPTEEPTKQKSIEKSIKPPAEPSPVQETIPSEKTWDDEGTEDVSINTGNSEGIPEGETGREGTIEEVPEGGAITDREYEALLAYIKDFIDKNLLYPPMARRRNIEGVVGVHFKIEPNGGLTAIAVDHSSGSSILDNAAVSLIRKIHPFENIAIKKELVLRVNIEYKLTE